MINFCKTLSSLCLLLSIVWFATRQEFGAVLLGILSLCAFMMTFLPIGMAKDKS